MIRLSFQFVCLAILFSPAPIWAADAMHYTTLGAKKGTLNRPDLSIKSLNFAKEEEKRQEANAKQDQEDKAFEAVWERYRALAEGKASQPLEKEASKPIKPKLISAPKYSAMPKIEPAASAAQEPVPAEAPSPEYVEKPLAERTSPRPTGILDQYEHSKAKRSQMKMIRIGKPQLPEPPVAPVAKETKQPGQEG